MTGSGDFSTFTNSYRPLRFKFLLLPFTERMPRVTTWDGFYLGKLRLKSHLGMPITYFDLRPSLTPEGKKRADMAFLTHVREERERGAENVSGGEIIRYLFTKFRYWPEVSHVNKTIGTPKADNYMLRWGYLLDFNPSFIELIHGTDNDTALHALENLQ
jgi:hypothetical protein